MSYMVPIYVAARYVNQNNLFVRVEGEGPWMCEIREMWEGTIQEALVRKDLNQENGEEFPYADRRQELVFIGMRLNHEAIQNALDQCLLDDEEMKLGLEKWEESFASVDKIQLTLDVVSDYEEDSEGKFNFCLKAIRVSPMKKRDN